VTASGSGGGRRSEDAAGKANALKITNQYRSKTGFVYDLKCNGMRLTVGIAPRQGPTDPGEWCVEGQAGSLPDMLPIAAWGPTRSETLSEVGRQWVSKTAELGLPEFDWVAVAAVLADVRAI
jgi:hypothetical protein